MERERERERYIYRPAIHQETLQYTWKSKKTIIYYTIIYYTILYNSDHAGASTDSGDASGSASAPVQFYLAILCSYLPYSTLSANSVK